MQTQKVCHKIFESQFLKIEVKHAVSISEF